MATKIQLRHDTAANWQKANPVLMEGELGIVTDDPKQYKVGDGVTAWNSLPLRGFDGTLIHELGNSETAAMSQKAITDLFNAGYLFVGIATPDTDPGTPDQNVFYIATEPGTYANFGGIKIAEEEAVILQWNNETWSKNVTGFATSEKLTELEQKVTGEYAYRDTIFANDRLNRLISVNNKEISVCVNLVLGEDDSIVRVYSKDLSKILVNNKKFGEVFDVVVPEGDEQIVVFTTNKIATNARKFEVIIIDGGIYKALEDKLDDAPKDDKPYFRQNGEWRETEIDEILDVSTAKEDSIAGAKITAHKFSNIDSLLNGGGVTIDANVEYSDNYLDINCHRVNRYVNFNKYSVGDDVTNYLQSNGGANDGYAFARCEIKVGVTYKCYGKVNAYAALVITDENAIIVSKITSGDYTITPYIFTAETNGYLFVQTTTFTDWETCKATYIETIQRDGVFSLLEDVAKSASPLKDKTIVCLGDSITEFTYQGKGYVEYLAELTRANAIRGGIGGSRISSRNPNFAEPTGEGRARAGLDMVNLVNAWCSGDFTAIDADVEWIKTNLSIDYSDIVNNLKNTPITSVDIVTILGGTNDFSGNVQLGTDIDTDVAMFIPALKSVIDTINIANPKAKVYVFTPIVRYLKSIKDDEHWSDVYLNDNGNTLPKLVEIIKDVSKSRHTPCCDLYWGLGWNKNNFDAYFISTDFTHPYLGFYALAEKMSKYLISN